MSIHVYVTEDGKNRLPCIVINDTFAPYSDWIAEGEKTEETRRIDAFKSIVGKRIGIIRKIGTVQTLIGTCVLGKPNVYENRDDFDAAWNAHRVKFGSPYYIDDGKKYGYPIYDFYPCHAQRVYTKGVSHIRYVQCDIWTEAGGLIYE